MERFAAYVRDHVTFLGIGAGLVVGVATLFSAIAIFEVVAATAVFVAPLSALFFIIINIAMYVSVAKGGGRFGMFMTAVVIALMLYFNVAHALGGEKKATVDESTFATVNLVLVAVIPPVMEAAMAYVWFHNKGKGGRSGEGSPSSAASGPSVAPVVAVGEGVGASRAISPSTTAAADGAVGPRADGKILADARPMPFIAEYESGDAIFSVHDSPLTDLVARTLDMSAGNASRLLKPYRAATAKDGKFTDLPTGTLHAKRTGKPLPPLVLAAANLADLEPAHTSNGQHAAVA